MVWIAIKILEPGGFADGNGDDQLALYNGEVLVDFYGNIGQDGSGQWHEFEDGRAERAADVATGCADSYCLG